MKKRNPEEIQAALFAKAEHYRRRILINRDPVLDEVDTLRRAMRRLAESTPLDHAQYKLISDTLDAWNAALEAL